MTREIMLHMYCLGIVILLAFLYGLLLYLINRIVHWIMKY